MIGLQQNGALTQIGGGITQSVLDRITDLENRLENVTNMLQGKLDASKVTSSTSVTEEGYAMDARQANQAVDGSLANKIEQAKNAQKRLYALNHGIEIPEGADLNSYKETGNYYCPYNVVVETLKNCPIGNAFTMKIELSTGNGYPSQTLRDHGTGFIYYRNCGSSTEPYGPWHIIKTELVQD